MFGFIAFLIIAAAIVGGSWYYKLGPFRVKKSVATPPAAQQAAKWPSPGLSAPTADPSVQASTATTAPPSTPTTGP